MDTIREICDENRGEQRTVSKGKNDAAARDARLYQRVTNPPFK